MKWLIGTLAAAFAAWIKALLDRAYVSGYSQALKDAERQQEAVEKAVDRQFRDMKKATR